MHILSTDQVSLNVLIKRANRLGPATKMIIQKFVPFPAVGKLKHRNLNNKHLNQHDSGDSEL